MDDFDLAKYYAEKLKLFKKLNNEQRTEIIKKAKKMFQVEISYYLKEVRCFPGVWPAYYKKAKGCKVWDLNNKVYCDFAGMGVTACVLGYSNSDLNKALQFGLKNGSMCTLNAAEEVELAKELLKIHKWSEYNFANLEVKHAWLL